MAKKQKITCPTCGIVFWRPAHRKAVFCSYACRGRGITPWNKGTAYDNLKTRKGDYPKCLYCREAFYRPLTRKTQVCCSMEHMSLYLRDEKQVRGTCENCKKVFWSRKRHDGRSETQARFCSIQCKHDFNRTAMKCDYCDNPILVYNSEIQNRTHHFCNKDCFIQWQRGPNSIQWKGGFYYNNIGQKMIRTEEMNPEGYNVYRPEHRVIIEDYIGRKLDYNDEPTWHLNGIMDDNSIDNLYVFSCRGEMQSALAGISLFPQKSNIAMLKYNNLQIKNLAPSPTGTRLD